MDTSKQLQEKGDEEFKKVEKQFMSDIENGRADGIYVLDTKLFKDFLHQQTTLAFEAGKAETLAMVLKEIEEIEEYIAVKDNDSHRYQIPISKKTEWNKFLEIPDDDERSWDVPEWAERIDGMPVKSALDTLKTKLTAKGEVKGFYVNATETPIQGTHLVDFIPGDVSKLQAKE